MTFTGRNYNITQETKEGCLKRISEIIISMQETEEGCLKRISALVPSEPPVEVVVPPNTQTKAEDRMIRNMVTQKQSR
jgi:hypothetical protein